MSPKLAELIAKLHEILQIDKPELDFGIYRIIRARAAQINRFLDESLPQKVRAVLTQNAAAEKAALEAEIAAAEQAARDVGINVDAAPKVLELRSRLAAVDSALADSESVVYAHLLAFFSRYYDAGDFISKRRYKGDVYAVPYAGEEVKLHWANAEQYYTKTGENFTDYSFRLSDGARVNFKLVSAAVAKDNVKDADAVRCFTLWDPEEAAAAAAEETDADAGDDDVPASALPDKILEEKNGELFIYFQYKKFPKGTKQKELAKDAREKIAAALTRADLLTKFPLLASAPTENDRARTVLDRELTRYVAKNTSDYFIHKDLKGFLTRELDFYVKNEMMQLDDIQNAATFRQIEGGLRRIQAVRAVALELIDFMAQLEEFQKSLWLKKKFVVQCDYCFTLDRVPAEMLGEVLENAAQKAEWEKLGFPPLPEAVPAGELPLAERKLDSRMVDTKFFPPSFKEKLLASIDDIDAQCDGVLVRSENFQALNLLRERYRGQIKCIYIDPPYNTDSSPILYKNSYKDSSWLSMLENRLSVARDFLPDDGIIAEAIDEVEFRNLVHLGNIIFGKENYISSITTLCNPQGRTDKFSNPVSEYHIVHAKSKSHLKGVKIKKLKKEEGVPLKRTGTNSRREERPLRYFPMLVKNGVVSTISKSEYKKIYNLETRSFDDEYVSALCKRYTEEGFFVVLPKKEDGTLLVWQREFSRVLKECSSYFLRNETIYTPSFENETPKTCWIDSVYANPEYGTELLKTYFRGEDRERISKSTPKSVFTVMQFPRMNLANSVLDFFAGSGTTGHAVINLNREDGGKRKYILVEMGEHFETVLKPRIEKVVYSPNWKNGKPQDSDQGVSHCFKYMILESYEDALTNLELADAGGNVPAGMLDQYLLHYMLRTEARAARLSTEDFRKPFDFTLNVAADASGATEPCKVDLVETFNWLLGLRVRSLVSRKEKGYVRVEGELPDGRRALILWRDCEKIDDSALAGTLERLSINLRSDADFDVFYVNGDHALPNVSVTDGDDASARKKVLQIEDEFLRRMFEEDV